MSTQQYPQLPRGTAGAPPATSQPMHPGYYAPPGLPAPVPAVPPRPRSTAFWVGITAAVALGIVAALLVGFFIGRGTRLSNEDVQSKVTAQSQADQIAEQKALDAQTSAFQKSEAATVSNAHKSAYAEGQQAGFTAGQQAGYSTGQTQGFSQGQASGVAQGESQGFSTGLNQGACFANSIFCGG